jgi:hypothetical protein
MCSEVGIARQLLTKAAILNLNKSCETILWHTWRRRGKRRRTSQGRDQPGFRLIKADVGGGHGLRILNWLRWYSVINGAIWLSRYTMSKASLRSYSDGCGLWSPVERPRGSGDSSSHLRTGDRSVNILPDEDHVLCYEDNDEIVKIYWQMLLGVQRRETK